MNQHGLGVRVLGSIFIVFAAHCITASQTVAAQNLSKMGDYCHSTNDDTRDTVLSPHLSVANEWYIQTLNNTHIFSKIEFCFQVSIIATFLC